MVTATVCNRPCKDKEGMKPGVKPGMLARGFFSRRGMRKEKDRPREWTELTEKMEEATSLGGARILGMEKPLWAHQGPQQTSC